MSILIEKVRQIEKMEQIDQMSAPMIKFARRATGSDAVKSALSGTWLGHQLHPMLTDIPIGSWMAAGFLDIVGPIGSHKYARRLVGLGILAAIPAAASGASDWSETMGSQQRVGYVHAMANSTALLLQTTSYLMRRKDKNARAALVSMAALATTAVAGYLGGHLLQNIGLGVDHNITIGDIPEWSKACALDDLTESKPLAAKVNDVSLALVKSGGSIYALSSVCAHLGGPLAEGTVEDECIACPWHASKFRLKDGGVVRGPSAFRQRTFATRVVNGSVEVRSNS